MPLPIWAARTFGMNGSAVCTVWLSVAYHNSDSANETWSFLDLHLWYLHWGGLQKWATFVWELTLISGKGECDEAADIMQPPISSAVSQKQETWMCSCAPNFQFPIPPQAGRGREREGEAVKAEAAQEGQVPLQLLRQHHLRLAILRQEKRSGIHILNSPYLNAKNSGNNHWHRVFDLPSRNNQIVNSFL